MPSIWVLCGGPSTEFDVSLSSGRVVCGRIRADRRTVRPVIIRRDGSWMIAPRAVENDDRGWLDTFFASASAPAAPGAVDAGAALSAMIRDGVDCAFLALHGQFGEDGRIQGFLQSAGIPFTGSGVLASALSFHKGLTLGAYRGAGLATPRGARTSDPDPGSPALAGLRFPLFVKPVQGGSSVGMGIARDRAELAAALGCALAVDSEALVEEKVEGVEVSCGVIDLVRDGRLVSTAMPPTEIRPVKGDFFDYEAKYTPGMSREITPAPLDAALLAEIRRCALAAHRVLGCEGMSRTDMIVPPAPGAAPVLLETNTIPGMTPTSILPQQAAAAGIGFADFLDALIAHAAFRALAEGRAPALPSGAEAGR